MTIFTEFNDAFSTHNLTELHDKQIVASPSVGIDNMSQEIFLKMRDEQLKIVNRKVITGSYKFTPYKLKLISKGQGKNPREISIPTVRDKIVLKGLCIFLQTRFQDDINESLPQFVIREVKSVYKDESYNAFIKLDVSNFYPSIPHDKMIKRIRKRIQDQRILQLIENAVAAPTVTKSKNGQQTNQKGVPQGLSISNVLAGIYLSTIDKRYRKDQSIRYFRYVDDILILCQKEQISEIRIDITKRFRQLGLKIHKEKNSSDKSTSGSLDYDAFSYLGYSFDKKVVSVRQGSIDKLRESILSIFTGYKHSKLKSIEFLKWRLDLRITGCIYESKSKGWLYFFSEIDNESLLHELDFFVESLCKRFGMPNLKPKKFTRAHFEIKHRRKESKYMQNFDIYNEIQMKKVLNVFGKNIYNMTSKQIKIEFKRRISKQVKELETDIQNAGSTN